MLLLLLLLLMLLPLRPLLLLLLPSSQPTSTAPSSTSSPTPLHAPRSSALCSPTWAPGPRRRSPPPSGPCAGRPPTRWRLTLPTSPPCWTTWRRASANGRRGRCSTCARGWRSLRRRGRREWRFWLLLPLVEEVEEAAAAAAAAVLPLLLFLLPFPLLPSETPGASASALPSPDSEEDRTTEATTP